MVKGLTPRQAEAKARGEEFLILIPIKRMNHDGNLYTMNEVGLTEYAVYPFSPHDDWLDCASRIYDMEPRPPVIIDRGALEPEAFIDGI